MDDRYLWDKRAPSIRRRAPREALGRFRHERRPLPAPRGAAFFRGRFSRGGAPSRPPAWLGSLSRALHPGGGSRALGARRSPAPLR
jgi:hypothetical protein